MPTATVVPMGSIQGRANQRLVYRLSDVPFVMRATNRRSAPAAARSIARWSFGWIFEWAASDFDRTSGRGLSADLGGAAVVGMAGITRAQIASNPTIRKRIGTRRIRAPLPYPRRAMDATRAARSRKRRGIVRLWTPDVHTEFGDRACAAEGPR